MNNRKQGKSNSLLGVLTVHPHCKLNLLFEKINIGNNRIAAIYEAIDIILWLLA